MKGRKINVLGVALVFILGACNGKGNLTQTHEIADPEFGTREKIKGDWGGTLGGPVWTISQDSILFHEKKKSYSYHLDGNMFSVKFDDRDTFTEFGFANVYGDTLRLTDRGGNNLDAYRVR